MKITASQSFSLHLLISLFLLQACGASPSTPTSSLCPEIENGLAFLQARYNKNLGLLNEAPQAAPHKYWLTNDNALAAYTFSQLDQRDLSRTIQESLLHYGYDTNGLVEVTWEEGPVIFPPDTARPVLITTAGKDEVWQEFHDSGQAMADWKEYTNLALLGVLNEYIEGRTADARSLYSAALQGFDGTGFKDKAYQENYETYKLAMALFTGKRVDATIPAGDQILASLLAMQRADGGFITHYRDLNTPSGDANTETTSWALLALQAYGCKTR